MDSLEWRTLDPAQRLAQISQACKTQRVDVLWSLTHDFLTQAHRKRPPTRHTARAYQQGINWALQCWPGDQLLAITPQQIKEAVARQERAGVGPATLKVRLAGVRAFFRALQWMEVVSSSPFEDLGPIVVRGQSQEREAYSLEELETLEQAAGPADRALIVLCAVLELSVSQVVGLRWSDIDLSSRSMKLSKGSPGSTRHTVLPPEIVAILSELPRESQHVLGFASDVRARQRLRRVCEQAGVMYRGVKALRPTRRSSSAGGVLRHHGSTPNRPTPQEFLPNLAALSQELHRLTDKSVSTGSSFGLLSIAVKGSEPMSSNRDADAIFRTVGARVVRLRRAQDFVAQGPSRRICVILEGVQSREVLGHVAQRFNRSLGAHPIVLGDQKFDVSIGVASALGPDEARALIHT